ncbi:MAG: M28 family peptidase, partial [Planctomycetaceae bacterium]|nr:M28 family peptidase [Planctomycetaceae bacterium]
SETDQTYGSRYQVELWRQRDELRRIRGVINVDMIGGQDVQMLFDLGSTAWLRDQIWATAERLGYGDFFDRRHPSTIGDDHIPFVKSGIPAVDLIDREYGPRNAFWHTSEDDMDKLNPQSFAVTAHVICEVLTELGVLSPSLSTRREEPVDNCSH